MNKISLSDYKALFGRKEYKALAESIGSSVGYFDSYACDPPKRKPSKSTCDKLILARPDLFSLKSLRPDFFSEPRRP